MVTHGSLFSGVGGFDLAAEWMGWTNVFHCEFNPFGQRVLKHYWPNAISYGDIKQTDFTIHRGQIDVLSGGFPCQPFSTAGKRKGTEDDRHLWPEMLRAILEIQPHYVVGENVRGFVNWNGGMVFDQVQIDLEAEGYEVLPFLLPACAVNAPHRRDRVWIIAHRVSDRSTRLGDEFGEFKEARQGGPNHEEDSQSIANTKDEREQKEPFDKGRGVSELIPYNGEKVRNMFGSNGKSGLTPDTERKRQQGPPRSLESSSTETFRNWKASWSYDDCRWPTQPPICGGNDGLPAGLSGITISKHRKESIMAYGNAIVPQVAFEIFKVIDQIETLH